MGDYKDCQSLIPNIYFNYYLQIGDEQYVHKDYDNALENYKKSKQYKSGDKDIDKKIKNAKIQIEQERIKARNLSIGTNAELYYECVEAIKNLEEHHIPHY